MTAQGIFTEQGLGLSTAEREANRAAYLLQREAALKIRNRLRNPPNAVPDTEIVMKNGRPVRQSNIVRFKPANIAKPAKPAKPVIPGYRGPDTFGRVLHNSMPYPIEAELPEREVVSVPHIIRVASEVFDVTEEELRSDSRCLPLTLYRQIAMALAVKLCRNNSLSNIGRYFRRDHTTCLHAKKKMAPLIEKVGATLNHDATLKEWVMAIKSEIEKTARR